MSNGEWEPGTSITFPRSFWYSVAITSGLLAILLISLVLWQLNVLSEEVAMAFSLPCTLISFFLSWVGFKVVRRRDHHPASDGGSAGRRLHVYGPFFFSLALIVQFIGNILHVYYDIVNINIFPSLADIFMWTACPLMLMGFLCFPVSHYGKSVHLRILLDCSLIIIALMTFSWYFLLGPILMGASGQSLFMLVAPLADLLLISYVILFSNSAAHGPYHFIMKLLSPALIIFTFCDSVHEYQHLHHIMMPGWCVLGWCIGNSVFALTAQLIRRLPAPKDTGPVQEAQRVAPMWRILLPYSFIPAVFGLAVYLWGTDRTSPLAIGTYGFSILLLIMLFTKQVVAIRDIHWFNRGLEDTRRKLAEKNEALEKLNERLEALATTDPLTALPNHRALQTLLVQELARTQHRGHHCTLLFFDLDHFKALNDGYGHAVGDEALACFGRLLHEQVRSMDTVGRWGGEEFLAVFPETGIQEARIFAERLCKQVSAYLFPIAGGLHLTCSIGMASYPTHASTMNDLINAADQAMYAAKKLGRNQWRCIDEPEVQDIITAGGNADSREATMLQGVVTAFVTLTERSNAQLGEHSARVAELVELVAVQLGCSAEEVSMMKMAGQLHDIGKIGIPNALLQKPASLTEQEWQRIRLHPEDGAALVASIPALRPLAPVIRAHHERWDGRGYPDKLQAEAIPLAARVISVTEAYVTMVEGSPYQKALSMKEALQELQNCTGTQFDPRVVNALTDILQQKGRNIEREERIVV